MVAILVRKYVLGTGFLFPQQYRSLNLLPSFYLSYQEKLEHLTHEDYNRIFKKSAVKRVKYEGLLRNINILRKNKSEL